MDVVNDIEILETDVRDCNEKCKRLFMMLLCHHLN
jgi:hypothetical protein